MGNHWPVTGINDSSAIIGTPASERGASAARLAILTPLAGLVAQSVEQRIENPRVGGSIPPQATSQFNGLHVFTRCKPLCFV